MRRGRGGRRGPSQRERELPTEGLLERPTPDWVGAPTDNLFTLAEDADSFRAANIVVSDADPPPCYPQMYEEQQTD